jgi:mono/diheme cytochrome c family protein
MRPAILTLVLTTALFTAGCGAVGHLDADDGDPSVGKALFIDKCSACHTLADAKATGKIGPNLDEAFRYDKKQGFDESTIRDVVRGQIAYATSDPGTGFPGMPTNIVRGQQAKDVAIYVAQCSAEPTCNVQAATSTG